MDDLLPLVVPPWREHDSSAPSSKLSLQRSNSREYLDENMIAANRSSQKRKIAALFLPKPRFLPNWVPTALMGRESEDVSNLLDGLAIKVRKVDEAPVKQQSEIDQAGFHIFECVADIRYELVESRSSSSIQRSWQDQVCRGTPAFPTWMSTENQKYSTRSRASPFQSISSPCVPSSTRIDFLAEGTTRSVSMLRPITAAWASWILTSSSGARLWRCLRSDEDTYELEELMIS